MARVPSSLNNSDTAVNRNIDSSLYDNVKIVADSIDDVVVVSDDLVLGVNSKTKIVAEHIVSVDTVSDNINSVVNVANNISAVNTVSSISSAVANVSFNSSKVGIVASNISKVALVSDTMSVIQDVDANISSICNLDLNMNSIIIDATNIGDINTIGNDLNLGGWASIKDNGSITDAVTVEPQGVSVIKNVSDHMTDITNITTNLTAIQEAPANAISASNSATSALASKNLAEKWASELEDVVVADGKYSSYHWAQKSADLFTNGVSLNNLTDVDTTGVMQGGIIRYDETTGWKVFDFSHSDKIGFNLTGTAVSTGEVSWNPNEGTLDVGLINGSVLQIGQENIRLVRNATGVTITNGTVCMYAGTIGSSGRVKVTPYTGVKGTEMYVYGVATQDITNGSDGYVTIEGKVRGIDTTGSSVGETWVDGDVLYAKPNDNGALTKIMPSSNEIKVEVASVIKAHSNGTLEVRVLPIDRNYSYTKTESDMTFVPRVGDFNLDLGGL